ncbi:MAG: phage portal protein [Clostridium butyricum]|nr:phage portal protein [Clostridium butyricum]
MVKLNWLDGVISFVSPEWGVKREAYRQYLDEIRNYDAGSYGRTNSNWKSTNQSAEMTDRYYRDNVRARCRDLERNSDIMNSVVGAFKRNIIGGGYTLQAKTSDDDINKSIEELWKVWCKKNNCDVTGTQSFNQMIRMAVERKKIDGGIIFLKRYTKDGIIPFQLQAIEVDELDIYQMVPKNNKNKVVGGIEYNEYNKAVGYWIKQYSIDGFTIESPIYIEAKYVIFYYSKKRPSQVREMSDMAPTITRIRDANEFMTAVSVKERIAACLSVFIKKTLPTTGIGGRNNIIQSKNDYEGKTISPGMIKELNAGDEIQVVNPSGQSADATGYIKLQQRLIGAGQGISYEATSRDMSETNYSSARQGTIEDELTYDEDVELLIENVIDEVYETFIISAYLSGKIDFKEFWNNKEIYLKHEWIKAPKRWIDPLKEANANKIALQTGQKTFKQIAAENGKDWKEQIDEFNEVLQYAKDQGIDLGGVIFGKKGEELYYEGQ